MLCVRYLLLHKTVYVLYSFIVFAVRVWDKQSHYGNYRKKIFQPSVKFVQPYKFELAGKLHVLTHQRLLHVLVDKVTALDRFCYQLCV